MPAYRRHKPTSQAVVTLSGRDIHLCRYGSKESRAEYNRLIDEWLGADFGLLALRPVQHTLVVAGNAPGLCQPPIRDRRSSGVAPSSRPSQSLNARESIWFDTSRGKGAGKGTGNRAVFPAAIRDHSRLLHSSS